MELSLGGESGPAERGEGDGGDLPAPKRPPAMASLDLDDLLGPAGAGVGGGHEADLPAPRISFEPSRRSDGGGGDVTDLPAPKRGQAPPLPSRPGPAPAAAGIAAFDALSGPTESLDLPAPRGAAPASSARSGAGGADHADLPAPRRQGAAARAHAGPPPMAPSFDDLPAPRGPGGVADLPAPRGPGGLADLPAPRGPAGVADLPAPRGPAGLADLPAPRGPAGLGDLPTPKASAHLTHPATRTPPAPFPPLAPGAGPELADLPTPRPGGFSELPMPRPGGFSELPIPRQELPPELPVPKGFFDDLPQPALPGASSDLAPKGFFDDLPKPTDVPTSAMAPKGFFDDAPGRLNRPPGPAFGPPGAAPIGPPAGPPVGPSIGGGPMRSKAPSAPGSLFDDIPVPSGAGADELGLRAPRSGAPSPPPLDLGANPSIDLGLPPPTRPSSASIPPPMRSMSSSSPPLSLSSSSPGMPMPDVGFVTDEARPKHIPAMPKSPPVPAAVPRGASKRTKILLAAVLGLAVLGGGGFFGYQRYAAAQERREQIALGLTQARRALVASDPGHWQRASNAVKRVLALENGNSEAIGLGAEAAFAGAIDDGVNATARIRAGKQLLTRAAAEAITTAPISRARALSALASGNSEHSATQLKALMPDPNAADANLRLYFAWAQAALGDNAAAVAAYDQALAAQNPHKISALYGRGQAKMAQGDLEGARADFAAVLELDKAHLGAQVSLAAALPSAQAQQREVDLLAILARKDLAEGDPRVLARAWRLAGDEARRGGRLEVAAERYRKGLELLPDDVQLLLGTAQLELANGRAATARETIDKVLALAAGDLGALLVAAEVDLAQNQLDAAGKRLDEVRAAKPTHPLLQARLAQLSGRLLEATEDYDGALKLYREAIAAAGEADLAPTMAAVGLLTRLADRADGEDKEAAAAHRVEIETLLEPLTKRAAEDSSVAVTLGAAYLAGGNPAKAEEWLTRATAQRPNDPDAKLQLAKALRARGKVQESIELLTAAFAASPERADIGAELARTMETAGRGKEAAALYEKLLESATVPVSLRAHAGRFLARQGQIERAAAQGEAILEQVPAGDAAGYFLRGLGLLHADKLDDARRDLQRAANLDHDPEYLDALGDVTEKLWRHSGDTRFLDEALRAYTQASEAAPLASALHGIGRLRLERREAPKALEALLQANQLSAGDGDILYLIGVAYQELRKFKAAAAWLESSLAVKARPEAEYRLGLAQLELEQAGKAAAALTRATSGAMAEEKKEGAVKIAWLTEALYLLGRVEHDRRNEAAARRAWEAYLGRNPSNLPQVDEVKRLLLGLR